MALSKDYEEMLDFWKNKGFPPPIAIHLNVAFWNRSFSEILDMTDKDIHDTMNKPIFSTVHKQMVEVLVLQARIALLRRSNIPAPSPSRNPTDGGSGESHRGNPDASLALSPYRNPNPRLR